MNAAFPSWGGLVAAAALGLMAAAPAQAVPVDLELYLMNDDSGSIDSTDFALIVDGYEAAFRSAALINAIQTTGTQGAIAVAFGFFAGSSQQQTSIGWTLIDDVASANAFADQIAALSRPFGGSTSPTGALDFVIDEFTDNGYESTRRVVDITMDGEEGAFCSSGTSLCAPLQDARDAALAGEIDIINALLIDDRGFFGDDPGDAVQAVPYAQNNVIGGPGAFAVLAQDFTEFGQTVQNKLLREVAPPPVNGQIPLPGALPLMGAALAGLGLLSRRRR